MRDKKKFGKVKVDPRYLAVREKGPKRAFLAASKYYSKTRMDKN